MSMMKGIASRRIAETPIAVIDFETTGLSAGADRVLEVSVVRCNPGEAPKLILDTLVNPGRPVSATEIHGISDDDVRDAPAFRDIAGELLTALEGCVIASYNVYFDIKFLHFELFNAGIRQETPHMCLMYMRPMLGLGGRCRLVDACQYHGVDYVESHVAADDAMAAAMLYGSYLPSIKSQGLRTFQDLTRLRNYKFFKSFSNEPLPNPKSFNLPACSTLFSRSGHVCERALTPEMIGIRSYWDALKTTLADLEISDEELAYVIKLRREIALDKEQIRVLHARAFATAIHQFCADQRIDDREVKKLRRLRECLSKLGWAPGD